VRKRGREPKPKELPKPPRWCKDEALVWVMLLTLFLAKDAERRTGRRFEVLLRDKERKALEKGLRGLIGQWGS